MTEIRQAVGSEEGFHEAVGSEEHFADDDGGQADDDGANPHAHVGKAVALGDERPGDGHEAVGKKQAQDDGDIGIDAIGADHVGVKTRGPDGGADFGAEKPVQEETEEKHRSESHGENHELTVVEEGFEAGENSFLPQKGEIGLPHDPEIDGVKGDHGQNTREKRRDLELRRQPAGDDPRQHTGSASGEDGGERAAAVGEQPGGHGSPQREAPFYGEIGDVQHAKRQVDA